MNWLSLPLFFFTISSYAITDANNHWAVNSTQFLSAACKTQSAPADTEMDAFINSLEDQKISKQSHNGVQFVDESKKLLKAFKQLVGPKDIQAQYNINPECQKVACAVEKIWGSELGKKLLFMKLKHGFNGSELAFRNSSRFTPEEMDEVLMALNDLPPHHQNLGGGNQRLVLSQSDSSFSKRAAANSDIKLYPLWRQDGAVKHGSNSYYKQYTLFHELGHNAGDRLDTKGAWSKVHKEAGCAVSIYGQTNKVEDFAETFVAYRYSAASLKAACPSKYNYMKEKVYSGVEYSEESLCRKENSPLLGQPSNRPTESLTATTRAPAETATTTATAPAAGASSNPTATPADQATTQPNNAVAVIAASESPIDSVPATSHTESPTLTESLSTQTPDVAQVPLAAAEISSPTITPFQPIDASLAGQTLIDIANFTRGMTSLVQNSGQVDCELEHDHSTDLAPGQAVAEPLVDGFPRIDSEMNESCGEGKSTTESCICLRETPVNLSGVFQNYREIFALECESRQSFPSGFRFQSRDGHPHLSNLSGLAPIDRDPTGRYAPGSHLKPSRDIRINSHNHALNETYLEFEDLVGANRPGFDTKTTMILIPRKHPPRARTTETEIHLTLPTGEVVVFDKATNAIKSGALNEGAFNYSFNPTRRTPPKVDYAGKGISIRLNFAGFQIPTKGAKTAEIKQGGRSCSVASTHLFDGRGKLKTRSDSELVAVLNQRCPAKPGQAKFSF